MRENRYRNSETEKREEMGIKGTTKAGPKTGLFMFILYVKE